MRNLIYISSVILLLPQLSAAQNSTFNNRTDFIASCDSCVIESEMFSGFVNGQEIESLFSGRVIFEDPYPTIFAGGWQGNCSSNEFSGNGLIPEDRFEGNPLIMNFCPPVFGVGAVVYDDHDGTPITNELTLTLITTQGNILTINEICNIYGEAGFLGGISDDLIDQAIWSIDNNDGNLEIDYLTICSRELSLDLGNDTLLCENESLILEATQTSATYLWSDNSSSPTLTVNSSGSYWVEVSVGCYSVRDTIEIMVVENTLVNLGNDTIICDGDTILLNAYHPNAISYIWQDGSTNPSFIVSQAGNYVLTITDANGCSTTDSVNISVDNSLCPSCPKFGIPNVFTPNSDQVNDSFFIFSDGEFEIIDFKVYGRWGNLVHNLPEPWDGTYKDEPAPSDVYIYLVTLKTDCETKQFRGDVTLIR